MALPTTESGPRPPMGAAAWAVPTPAPSGQQHVDFSNVSAAAAPPGPQLVANFHGQQQMHPQLLQQQQQQQQQSHHSQPQLQQSFGLYDHYYNPGQEQYGFVPTSQPQLERQGYHPSQLGQLPGSTAVHYELAPPLSQPEQAAHYNQSFTSTDIPIFLKQERSPSSPAQQQASSTPPHPAAPAGPRHRERPSVDAISALPGQVEAATSVTMAKTKSPSATSMRKTGSASSPKAGLKRSREEADVGGDNEGSAEPEEQQKKRGRPRLEGGGESRGERRRQQIRDAQRAYRNRKDNRIVELEEQVERLEREKVDMSRDFGSVLDLLRAQGIAQTSAVIAQRFDDLCRKYPLGTLDYHDGDAQSVMSSNAGRERFRQPGHRRQTLGTISSASSDHHSAVPAGQGRPPAQGPNVSFGSSGGGFYVPENLAYEVITQPTPENASFPSYAPDPQAPNQWIEQPPLVQLPPGTQPPPTAYQVFFQQQVGAAEQAVSINNSLAGPNSSAAHEATFGRRLQRRTLERALYLAEMENPPPDRFGAVFGFCLLVESKDRIVERLRSCLHSFKEESLNYWRYPFTNLGGIGFSSPNTTNNARTDSHGYIESYKPQHMTGYSMGPFPPHIEAVKDTRLDKRMQINFPGFSGEFLDSDEAERYLRAKGIEIPAMAEWVTVEVSTNDFGDGSETETVPVEPQRQPVSCAQDAGPVHGAWPRVSGPDAITTMFSDGSVTGAADTGAMHPFLCPAVPLGSWTSTRRSNPKFKTTIQVSTLVEEMVNRSVCLGRAPGIRPKDIDRAVKLASGLYKDAT